MSTWESPCELEPGSPLPPPFSRMVIGELLCRTNTGGYLYRVEASDATETGQAKTETGTVE